MLYRCLWVPILKSVIKDRGSFFRHGSCMAWADDFREPTEHSMHACRCGVMIIL